MGYYLWDIFGYIQPLSILYIRYNQLMVNTLDPLSQYAKQVPVMLGQME